MSYTPSARPTSMLTLERPSGNFRVRRRGRTNDQNVRGSRVAGTKKAVEGQAGGPAPTPARPESRGAQRGAKQASSKPGGPQVAPVNAAPAKRGKPKPASARVP